MKLVFTLQAVKICGSSSSCGGTHALSAASEPDCLLAMILGWADISKIIKALLEIGSILKPNHIFEDPTTTFSVKNH